jgi:hypothetical protein
MIAARLLTGILLIGLMSLPAMGEDAVIYKWVDKDGVTGYGSLPPSETDSEATRVRVQRTDKAALQSKRERQSNLSQAKNVRKQNAAQEANEANQDRKDNAAEQAENCDVARDRVERYNTAYRLFKTDENGERVYLTDEELDATRANAMGEVNKWCGDA